MSIKSKTLTLQCHIGSIMLSFNYLFWERTNLWELVPIITWLKQGLSYCLLRFSTWGTSSSFSVLASHNTTEVARFQMNTIAPNLGYHARFTQQAPFPTEPTTNPCWNIPGDKSSLDFSMYFHNNLVSLDSISDNWHQLFTWSMFLCPWEQRLSQCPLMDLLEYGKCPISICWMSSAWLGWYMT